MNSHKIKLLFALMLLLFATGLYGIVKGDSYKVAIPSDPTNMGRALLFLQSAGIIELDENVGLLAAPDDIISSYAAIDYIESEAFYLPSILGDVDFAVINGPYAVSGGLVPKQDSLASEGDDSPYCIGLCVREDNKNSALTRALVAAFSSDQIVDYIKGHFSDGDVIPTINNITNGYDMSVDYDALDGISFSLVINQGAHDGINGIAYIVQDILSKKNIIMEIVEESDFVEPHLAVENGEAYANCFAHRPYLESLNSQYSTHIDYIMPIYLQPMGIYGGRCKDLSVLINTSDQNIIAEILQKYSSIIYLPENITIIQEGAFEGIDCEAVVVPINCQTIEKNAFKNCDMLQYVIVPNNTIISDEAFAGCSDVIIDRSHY